MCTPWNTKRCGSSFSDRMPLQRRMFGPSACTRFWMKGKNLSGSSGASVLSEIERIALQHLLQRNLRALGAMQPGVWVDAADARLGLAQFRIGHEIGLVDQ